VNHLVPRLSGRGEQDIRDGYFASVFWKPDIRPRLFVPAHPHMGQLHLLAREAFFDMEMQADQGESDRDGLGLLIGRLGRKSVYDVLMDERRIGMRKGVVRKLFVLFLEGILQNRERTRSIRLPGISNVLSP